MVQISTHSSDLVLLVTPLNLVVLINAAILLIIFSFIAKDFQNIKRFVQEPCSKSVYVIMAQVLDERVPPFILQMFGTNGSFTGGDVIRRWHYTKDELEKYVIYKEKYVNYSSILYSISKYFRHGVELAGISSDGDPRLLSAMVYESSLPNGNGINVIQDITI